MLKNRFFKSEFIKNVLILLTGTGLAQVITLLASPILSRMYTPVEYGVFTVFVSVASAIAVIASAKYELAIMLPKYTNQAVNVLFIALYVCIATSLSIGFLVLIAELLNYFGFISLAAIWVHWLWFLPFFIFFVACYQAFNMWMVRVKNYKGMSASRIFNSLFNNGFAVLFGVFKFGAWGIFLANLIGQFFYALNLFYYFLKGNKKDVQYVSKNKMKSLASRYKDFPKISTIQAVVDMLQVNGLIYLLPVFFSIVEVGYYSRALIVLQAPVSLLGAAVSQVFFQKASEIHSDNGELKPLVISTIKKAFLFIFPVVIVLIVFGPLLFSFVFGAQWNESGVYARILAIWLFFDFIRMSVSQLPIILGKQRQLFLITILGPVILLSSMIVGHLVFNDVHVSLCLFAIGQSLLILFLITWIFKIIPNKK
jgi:O-antigen/teichoic acid export membrane protein